jgi:hypothetical protein
VEEAAADGMGSNPGYVQEILVQACPSMAAKGQSLSRIAPTFTQLGESLCPRTGFTDATGVEGGERVA